MYAAIGAAVGTAIDELIEYMSDDDDEWTEGVILCIRTTDLNFGISYIMKT